MTRRRVTIEIRDGKTAVIRGWEAQKLALQAGIRATYNGVAAGWVFDTRRLPDFVAGLQYRNIHVDITGAESTCNGQSPDSNAVQTMDPPLFEIGGAS